MKRTILTVIILAIVGFLAAQPLMTAGGNFVSTPGQSKYVLLSVSVNSGTEGTVSIFYDPNLLRFDRTNSDCPVASNHPGCLAVYVSPDCQMKFDARFSVLSEVPDYVFNVFLVASNSDEIGSTPAIESMHKKVIVAGVPTAPIEEQAAKLDVDVNPNPFNLSTQISLNLTTPGRVEIGVYDVDGKLVRKIACGEFKSGAYSFRWDATDDAGKTVPSGIYFVRIHTPSGEEVRRVQLVK